MTLASRCQSGIGDGCGRIFPNKDNDGLCRKCFLLSRLDSGSEQFESICAFPQCKGCGGTWRYFKGSLCDDCLEKENKGGPQPSSTPLSLLSTQAIESAKAARSHAMDVRINKKKNNPLHTTAALNHARASVSTLAAADKISVSVEVRIKDVAKRISMSTDPTFGKWARLWEKNVFLSQVLDDSLTCVNSIWEKDEVISLVREEVEFRFANNKVFLPGTQNGTVGDTYTKYMTGENAGFYKPSDARVKAAKGPTLFLELYINKVAFDKRVHAMEDQDDSDTDHEVETRKRRRVNSSLKSLALLSTVSRIGKKPRTLQNYSQLSSRFVRTSLPPHGVSDEIYDTIKFVRAEAGYVADTSDIEVVWPGEGCVIESALIARSMLAEGGTKRVYKVMIKSELFVAKRFFENSNSGSLGTAENAALLKQELVRLKQMHWFWKEFRALAKEKNVDICQDIQVSEGFLIREQGPSSIAFDDSAGVDSAVWLVEPRRTTSLIKFSGTLCHPVQTNKMGMTITVFAHFVYEISKKTLVIADIQGSPISRNNRDGIVLFDLMTHSINGSSGAGDHGTDGILTFVEQHKCDLLCRGLDMPSLEQDKSQPGSTLQ